MRIFNALKEEYDRGTVFIPGNTYEYLAKNDKTDEYAIIECLCCRGGSKGYYFKDKEEGYTCIRPVDNSVMNVLAKTNADKFIQILCKGYEEDDMPDSKQEKCEIANKDVIINNMLEGIDNSIKYRVENHTTNICYFDIRINGFNGNIYKDKKIKEITDILDKNNVEWNVCDTVGGAFNLNDDWIETKEMECAIEYSGVYPIHWKDRKDIATLAYLSYIGYLSIHVMVKDGDYHWVPNI